jgi:arabinogalactan endo-1,4-beta-galactosidase
MFIQHSMRIFGCPRPGSRSARSKCREVFSRLLTWVVVGLFQAVIWAASANQVTYQVNMSLQRALGNFNPAGGDTVLVAGTFSVTNWATIFVLAPSPADSNVYTGAFSNSVAVGSYENHKFIIDPGGRSPAGQLNWETGNNRFFQVTAADQTLPAVYFNNITNLPAVAVTSFLAGADVSLLSFFESNGIAYKSGGQTEDALAILKNSGVNCVRLRLFTSSAAQAQADPYNYINNLAYTVPLAVRVKNAGLRFLLDFHYSDTWADPSQQALPAAWTNLDFPQLVQQMRTYNSNCIATFAAAGAMPDYVQVGNEITGGLLWPYGAVPGTNASVQWSQLAQLLNAAMQGIRDVASTNMPKIIVHIDRGGDWTTTEWFFDNLIQNQQVQFDIIGESYYPVWHGSPGALANCLTNAAARYGKPVLVAETAFPWTNSYWTTNIYGIPGTTNGQVQYVVALAQVAKSVSNGLGAGVFWWGTEYQYLEGVNEAGFNTASFFDAHGNVLPAAGAFGQMVAPLQLSASLSGSGMKVQWPLSGAGLTLTTTTSVAPGSVWLPVTNSIQNTGSVFYTTQSVNAGASHFYRLQTNN